MFLCTICGQIVNQTKRLTNILDVNLWSVNAQTVDEYFGRPFAVCKQTVDRYIRTKGKIKFNENQENNTLGE